MIEFSCIVVLVALLAAWVLLLMKKWGIIEWLQVYGTEKVSEAAHCSFCLSWWVCCVIAVALSLIMGEWGVLMCPFFATPITRLLVV